MDSTQHRLHGHQEFWDIGLNLQGVEIGAFDGWFDFEEDGQVSEIWVRGFDGQKSTEVHFTWQDVCGHWLASNLKTGIELHCADRIDGAVAERWPGHPERDPGPSQAERL